MTDDDVNPAKPVKNDAKAKKPRAKPVTKKIPKGLKRTDLRPSHRPISNQQQRFVQEYLVDFNGTQAAIRAGYAGLNADGTPNSNSARVIACQLLANPNVAKAVEEGKQELFRRIDITKERVMMEIGAVAFSNLQDVLPNDAELQALPRAAAATIKTWESETEESDEEGKSRTVTRKIQLHDKLGALDKLSKILGLTPDKDEDGGTNVNVTIQQVLAGVMMKRENVLGDAEIKAMVDARVQGEK